MAANEQRLHALLDLYEQAQKEGDKATALKAMVAYRRESAKEYVSPEDKPDADTYDKVVGSIPGRAVLGLGKAAVAGPFQIGSWIGGAMGGDNSFSKIVDESLAELAAAQKRGRAFHGSEGFDWAELSGSAVGGGGALGKVTGKAPTFLSRITEGAKTGAVFGAAQPVIVKDEKDKEDKVNTKIIQTAFGAVAGGGIPAAISLGQAGWRLLKGALGKVDPKDVGKLLNEYSGSARDRIIAELEKRRIYIPNSMPTAGQAAARVGSAEFTALGKHAENVLPTEYAAHARQQARARRGALVTDVAGKPKAREKAIDLRTDASKKAYEEAYQTPFTRGKGFNKALEVITTNPFYVKASSKADEIMTAKHGSIPDGHGGFMSGGSYIEYLHTVKEILDSQISGKASNELAIGRAELAAALDLKTKIVNFLSKHSPKYEAARKAHETASIPIDQMKLGQGLLEKLVAPLDDKEMAAAYSKSVRDILDTAKKETGRNASDITEVFTPKQIGTIYGIARDLQRNARYTELARKGSPEVSRRLTDLSRSPTGKTKLLDRAYVIFSSIISTATGAATRKTMREVAEVMLDPAKTAELMRLATKTEKAAWRDMLNEYSRLSTAAAIGTAAGQITNE
jgi:hypothetical protein